MNRRMPVLAVLLLLAGLAPGVPKTELSVVVPDYVAVEHGGLTEVTVPGGGMLYVEAGRPEVPYFTAWFGYPSDCRVQEVTLRSRAGEKVDSGLRLPVVHFNSYNDPVPDIAPKPGIYPAEDFSWRVVEGTGDSVTLALTVYPYRFDPATGIGTFHRRFDFDIRWVTSGFGIGSVTVTDPACDPGDTVVAVVRFFGAGDARGAKVRPSVLDAATRKPVARLDEIDPGPADSVVVAWPTRGRAAGQYLLELIASDPAGNELDREQAQFRIGRPQGEVTGFEVEPRCFDIGDDVRLTLSFRNTGSVALDGRCVFRILNDDEQVAALEQELTGLEPGASKTFRESWNTADAVKSAVYRAVGLVRFEGTATESRSTLFSTNLMPVASFTADRDTAAAGEAVSFDASASRDDDGRLAEFRWDFGDGGRGTGVNVSHRYMQPGEFTVRLTVVDDEDGTGTIERAIHVPE